MAEVIKQQQPKEGKPLFVFEAIPDNALVQDMIEKAKLYQAENVKKAVKTRYSLTKEQFSTINDTNREWYKKRLEDVIPQIRHDSAEEAFQLVVCIPIMVMRDHYKDLFRKDVDGKNREIRFYEYLEEVYQCFADGYVTLEDLQQCLFEETGLIFEREAKR